MQSQKLPRNQNIYESIPDYSFWKAKETSARNTKPPYNSNSKTRDCVSHVGEGIFLSGWQAETDAKELKNKGITHVLQVGGELQPSHPEDQTFRYLKLDMYDCEGQDLLSELPRSFIFITNALARDGKVLVHCFAGLSRSPSVIIAFLIWCRNRSLSEALSHVKSIRPSINPNLGFYLQLHILENAANAAAMTVGLGACVDNLTDAFASNHVVETYRDQEPRDPGEVKNAQEQQSTTVRGTAEILISNANRSIARMEGRGERLVREHDTEEGKGARGVDEVSSPYPAVLHFPPFPAWNLHTFLETKAALSGAWSETLKLEREGGMKNGNSGMQRDSDSAPCFASEGDAQANPRDGSGKAERQGSPSCGPLAVCRDVLISGGGGGRSSNGKTTGYNVCMHVDDDAHGVDGSDGFFSPFSATKRMGTEQGLVKASTPGKAEAQNIAARPAPLLLLEGGAPTTTPFTHKVQGRVFRSQDSSNLLGTPLGMKLGVASVSVSTPESPRLLPSRFSASSLESKATGRSLALALSRPLDDMTLAAAVQEERDGLSQSPLKLARDARAFGASAATGAVGQAGPSGFNQTEPERTKGTNQQQQQQKQQTTQLTLFQKRGKRAPPPMLDISPSDISACSSPAPAIFLPTLARAHGLASLSPSPSAFGRAFFPELHSNGCAGLGKKRGLLRVRIPTPGADLTLWPAASNVSFLTTADPEVTLTSFGTTSYNNIVSLPRPAANAVPESQVGPSPGSARPAPSGGFWRHRSGGSKQMSQMSESKLSAASTPTSASISNVFTSPSSSRPKMPCFLTIPPTRGSQTNNCGNNATNNNDNDEQLRLRNLSGAAAAPPAAMHPYLPAVMTSPPINPIWSGARVLADSQHLGPPTWRVVTPPPCPTTMQLSSAPVLSAPFLSRATSDVTVVGEELHDDSNRPSSGDQTFAAAAAAAVTSAQQGKSLAAPAELEATPGRMLPVKLSLRTAGGGALHCSNDDPSPDALTESLPSAPQLGYPEPENKHKLFWGLPSSATMSPMGIHDGLLGPSWIVSDPRALHPSPAPEAQNLSRDLVSSCPFASSSSSSLLSREEAASGNGAPSPAAGTPRSQSCVVRAGVGAGAVGPGSGAETPGGVRRDSVGARRSARSVFLRLSQELDSGPSSPSEASFGTRGSSACTSSVSSPTNRQTSAGDPDNDARSRSRSKSTPTSQSSSLVSLGSFKDLATESPSTGTTFLVHNGNGTTMTTATATPPGASAAAHPDPSSIPFVPSCADHWQRMPPLRGSAASFTASPRAPASCTEAVIDAIALTAATAVAGAADDNNDNHDDDGDVDNNLKTEVLWRMESARTDDGRGGGGHENADIFISQSSASASAAKPRAAPPGLRLGSLALDRETNGDPCSLDDLLDLIPDSRLKIHEFGQKAEGREEAETYAAAASESASAPAPAVARTTASMLNPFLSGASPVFSNPSAPTSNAATTNPPTYRHALFPMCFSSSASSQVSCTSPRDLWTSLMPSPCDVCTIEGDTLVYPGPGIQTYGIDTCGTLTSCSFSSSTGSHLSPYVGSVLFPAALDFPSPTVDDFVEGLTPYGEALSSPPFPPPSPPPHTAELFLRLKDRSLPFYSNPKSMALLSSAGIGGGVRQQQERLGSREKPDSSASVGLKNEWPLLLTGKDEKVGKGKDLNGGDAQSGTEDDVLAQSLRGMDNGGGGGSGRPKLDEATRAELRKRLNPILGLRLLPLE